MAACLTWPNRILFPKKPFSLYTPKPIHVIDSKNLLVGDTLNPENHWVQQPHTQHHAPVWNSWQTPSRWTAISHWEILSRCLFLKMSKMELGPTASKTCNPPMSCRPSAEQLQLLQRTHTRTKEMHLRCSAWSYFRLLWRTCHIYASGHHTHTHKCEIFCRRELRGQPDGAPIWTHPSLKPQNKGHLMHLKEPREGTWTQVTENPFL